MKGKLKKYFFIFFILSGTLFFYNLLGTAIAWAMPANYNVSNEQELIDSVASINDSTDNSFRIIITDDFSLSKRLKFEKGDIEVLGSGHTLTLTDSGSFHIEGANLTLGGGNGNESLINITKNVEGEEPFVVAEGSLIFEDGVCVFDCIGASTSAVHVQGSGLFHMKGGVIRDNTCKDTLAFGAVSIHSGGSFIMSGGEISNNRSVVDSNDEYARAFSGGVALVYGGKMTMSGGVISGNKIENGNHQSYGAGGIVMISHSLYGLSSATFSGGSLTGNKGVVGGGIMVYGRAEVLNMEGLNIGNNEAYRQGHDIYLNSSNDDIQLKLPEPQGQRDGRDITGWFLDLEENRWSLEEAEIVDYQMPVNGPIALVAAYGEAPPERYTVTFALEGGQPMLNPQSILQGETIIEPEEPQKFGHTFLGWYFHNTLWDFTRLVMADMTLTAKWKTDLEETTPAEPKPTEPTPDEPIFTELTSAEPTSNSDPQEMEPIAEGQSATDGQKFPETGDREAGWIASGLALVAGAAGLALMVRDRQRERK